MYTNIHTLIFMHTPIYAHIKGSHSHIRAISLNVASPSYKLNAIYFASALQLLNKNVLVFYFICLLYKHFVRQNSSLKNRSS